MSTMTSNDLEAVWSTAQAGWNEYCPTEFADRDFDRSPLDAVRSYLDLMKSGTYYDVFRHNGMLIDDVKRLQDIKRLELTAINPGPNDVIVVRMSTYQPMHLIERMRANLSTFFDGHKVLVLAPDAALTVVNDGASAEVKRLTEALAAVNADRDRMAQEFATLNQQYWNEHTDRMTAETNLGIAQSEARGLRQALHDLSIPPDGAI